MSQSTDTVTTGKYSVRNVIRSEIAKVMTLRSTAITLGLTVLLVLFITGMVTRHDINNGPPGGFYLGFDSTSEALRGMIVAALTIGVFGAMLITGEYASGTIRTSLAATPKRPVLLSAKVIVTAAVTMVFCELLSIASFYLGEAILSGGGAPSASLASHETLRAVLLTGLYVSLMALMSFGFGLIFRSTAASLAAFAGVVFVLEFVMHSFSPHFANYLPLSMLVDAIMVTVHGPGQAPGLVSPSLAMLLMAIYAAISLVVGWVLFVKRDA